MPNLSFQVWGRDPAKVDELIADMAPQIDVIRAFDLEVATRSADIVVTATGSRSPILKSVWVQPGTHITAVGADAPGKQELDVALVKGADIVRVDLVSQCLDHGEICHAASKGLLNADDLQQIGAILNGTNCGRENEDQITIADLTGIAAQDIAMANAVLATWKAQLR